MKQTRNKTPWSEQEIQFLKDNYMSMTDKQLSAALGRGASALRTQMKKNGLRRIVKRENWTPEEIQFLRENYELMTRKEIGDKINRLPGAVKSMARKLGITRSKAGQASIIKRIPNSGKFKNGHKPTNILPIGSIRKRMDSGGRLYNWIKIKEDPGIHPIYNWKMLHVHVWEENFGEVPEGHLIRFIDQDVDNCSPDNLQCVSMAENAAFTRETDGYIAMCLSGNGRGTYDKDARDAFLQDPELLELKRKQLKLNSTINKYEKEHKKNDR